MEKRIDLLIAGTSYLNREGLANAQGEAELILSHLVNCPRIELYLENLTVERARSGRYWDILTTRARGFPLQYLIGSTEFMGLKFKIWPGVFIPRPETEILVETTIDILTNELTNKRTNEQTILDIGCGCGNITISLAKYLEKARIFACDVSDSALQVARENSYLNRVNIFLIKSNLLSGFKKGSCFSLIVSNPPYINTREIPGLSRELHYEPRRAYDGGEDGLLFYRKIIGQAPDYLQDGGKLCLEIGDNQAGAVKEILEQSGKFSLLKVVKDYNDVERVIVVRK